MADQQQARAVDMEQKQQQYEERVCGLQQQIAAL
jgi:hypothetical protein